MDGIELCGRGGIDFPDIGKFDGQPSIDELMNQGLLARVPSVTLCVKMRPCCERVGGTQACPSRRQAKHSSLIKIRENFIPEMLKSAEDI